MLRAPSFYRLLEEVRAAALSVGFLKIGGRWHLAEIVPGLSAVEQAVLLAFHAALGKKILTPIMPPKRLTALKIFSADLWA
jgi:hypothetical protein